MTIFGHIFSSFVPRITPYDALISRIWNKVSISVWKEIILILPINTAIHLHSFPVTQRASSNVFWLKKQTPWRTEALWLRFQFSSVAQSCPTLCDPMDCSTLAFPVHHQLPEPAQIHVHKVGDAIQPSHPLSSPFPPTFNLSSIRVFSNQSVLHIRWTKDWSFSSSISSSNE